jgi:hypothetical protein
MATAGTAYPHQIYRFKHDGQSDNSPDEYATDGSRIDHGFIIETQHGDLFSAFDIAANGMIVVRAYYVTKSIRKDGFCRNFRTKCRVSFGGATQYLILVQCPVIHFDAYHTITATTDVWNTIFATSRHSEYVVHDDTSECRIRGADLCDFNITASIGGGVTTTAVTTTVLVAVVGQFSYDFPVTLL